MPYLISMSRNCWTSIGRLISRTLLRRLPLWFSATVNIDVLADDDGCCETCWTLTTSTELLLLLFSSRAAKTLPSDAATGSVANANVSLVSSTECKTWRRRGCRHRSNCLTPCLNISEMVSFRRGLCNLSAVLLSNRNTDASYILKMKSENIYFGHYIIVADYNTI